MTGQDVIVSDYDAEHEARCEAYEALIAANKELQVLFDQLIAANLELRDEVKKNRDLFSAYVLRQDDLDAATVAARKRSRELDAVYEKLMGPRSTPRRDVH
jgi:hypothetical protein